VPRTNRPNGKAKESNAGMLKEIQTFSLGKRSGRTPYIKAL